MLQVHTSLRVDQVERRLPAAAGLHGGSVLGISDVGRLVGSEAAAINCTVCFGDVYTKLLRADLRFAAFLPARIAVYEKGEGAILEAESPRQWMALPGESDVQGLAISLEGLLRLTMEDAAKRQAQYVGEHAATEDLINMRAALPQRLDCHGTKVEELAGTGMHDAAGG